MVINFPNKDAMEGFLGRVVGVADRRQLSAMSSMVLLSLDGEAQTAFCAAYNEPLAVKVAASTGDNGITISGSGSVVIPARILADRIAVTRSGCPVSLHCDDDLDANVVTLKCGEHVATIPTVGAATNTEYFSNSISDIDGLAVTVDVAVIHEIIDHVLFAASDDLGRLYLNGVFVRIDSDQSDDTVKIQAVATDGHRLAWTCRNQNTSKATDEGVSMSGLIHKSAFPALKAFIPKGCKSISLYLTKKTFTAVLDSGSVFQATNIEADFPAYDRVVPAQIKHTIKMPRKDVLDAVKWAMSAVKGESTPVIKLSIKGASEGAVAFTGSAVDSGDSGMCVECLIPDDIQGFVCAVNAKLFLDAVAAIDSEFISWGFNSPSSAFVLCNPDNPTSNKQIVMPVRI